ncbi:MAG: hypothetical protein F4149_07595 [Gammaproteobacteria bacterium]|nr:hypothetical protein [Gammaproteobacteria bacterium]MYK82567.1 hypothetical protein [Gammaproteobacteria bacterium]
MALSWTVLTPGAWPQDDGGLIEEVVVTATKREQGLYEVPASLSVFDGDELGERGIADLARLPQLSVISGVSH